MIKYISPEQKEKEELEKVASRCKSIEEFEQYLISGHSIRKLWSRFRVITGESAYSGRGTLKWRNMGGSQGESWARYPTDKEIVDFYNRAIRNKAKK